MPEKKKSELKPNSLAVKRPELVETLVNKDDGLLTCGSDKKIRWWCEKSERQHWYQATIGGVLKGKGCGVCAGYQVVRGVNDFATVYPSLAQLFNVEQTRIQAEKHPEKKWAMSPEKVTGGSGGWAVFDCDNGLEHWYQARILNKTQKVGCAVCAGRQVFPGFNDLASQRPDIAQYFNVEQTRIHAEKHPEKKWLKSLDEVPINSTFRAIWNCENEEEHWFEMTVVNRTRGQGCAVCASSQVFSGFNDLASQRPDIAQHFNRKKTQEYRDKHPEKRWALPPEKVTVKSNSWAVWNCDCGNTFERTLNSLAREGSYVRCSSCVESQGEKELAEFIADLLPEDMNLLRNDRTILRPRELDIYVPELRLAFEFNGDYHHSDASLMERCGETAIEYHTKKLDGCATQGIDLFFVWWSDWNDSRKRRAIEKYVQEIVLSQLNGEELKKDYAILKILSKS